MPGRSASPPTARNHDSAAGQPRSAARVLCRLALSLSLGLAAAAGGGCAGPGEAASALPDVEARVSYFKGTPIAGASGGSSTAVSTDNALHLTLEVFNLGELPEGVLEPLLDQIRFAVVDHGGISFLSPLFLGRGARAGAVTDRDAFLQSLGKPSSFKTVHAALPPGITADFLVASRREEKAASGEAVNRSVSLHVSREDPPTAAETSTPSPRITVALLLEGFSPTLESYRARTLQMGQSSVPTEAFAEDRHRELVLLRRREFSGSERGFAILCLSPFSGGAPALALLLTISPPPPADDAARSPYTLAVETCRKDLEDDAARASQGKETRPEEIVEQGLLEHAIEDLRNPKTRRSALIFLGTFTGAPLLADVAAAAAPQVIDAVTEDFLSGGAGTPRPTRAATGWELTKAFLKYALKQIDADRADPELRAIALRHMGEASRHPSFLEEAAATCASLEDFQARLARENVIYLHYGLAPARSRAYLWLDARGLAPKDDDPQAPRAGRGEAVLKKTPEEARAGKDSNP